MNTPLIRRPDANGASAEAIPADSSTTGTADGYPLPVTWRGIGAQAAAALGMLTGLWVAISPWFITLQYAGGNAAAANLISGLAVAAVVFASTGLARLLPAGPAAAQPTAGRIRRGRTRSTSLAGSRQSCPPGRQARACSPNGRPSQQDPAGSGRPRGQRPVTARARGDRSRRPARLRPALLPGKSRTSRRDGHRPPTERRKERTMS